MIKVTVWNEFFHEKTHENVKAIYPNGIHNTIADFLKCDDIIVRTATLDDPECGLTEEVLNDTDVLIYWAHCKHTEVPDEIAERVQKAVLKGMGAIFLHSSHISKPFTKIMGTSGSLRWHELNEKERLWVINPAHPIAQGIDKFVEIPNEEMYGEHFDIPTPDDLVFIGWFQSGEVFRSGSCFNRGYGKVFYFQPGHETFPIYHQPEIQKIIKNAVRWANPIVRIEKLECPNSEALKKI